MVGFCREPKSAETSVLSGLASRDSEPPKATALCGPILSARRSCPVYL